MTDSPETTDVVDVDAVGRPCPMPVIELAKAVRDHAVGTVFHLRATDEAARVDVPVWCRMQSQRLVDVQDEADRVVLFVVEKTGETLTAARS